MLFRSAGLGNVTDLGASANSMLGSTMGQMASMSSAAQTGMQAITAAGSGSINKALELQGTMNSTLAGVQNSMPSITNMRETITSQIPDANKALSTSSNLVSEATGKIAGAQKTYEDAVAKTNTQLVNTNQRLNVALPNMPNVNLV